MYKLIVTVNNTKYTLHYMRFAIATEKLIEIGNGKLYFKNRLVGEL